MKRAIVLLGVAVLFAGCGAKHEASTGKEWHEKFSAAVKEKDADTSWKMLSKGMQKELTDSAKTVKEMAEDQKTLKEKFEVDADPKTISDEDLAKKMLFGKDGMNEVTEWSFVSEKADGDNIAVTCKKDDKEKVFVLIKEDGSLKFDMEATQKFNKKDKE